MSDKKGEEYRLGYVPGVKELIRELGSTASKTGKAEEFLAALNLIVENLQSKPLEWGDPLFKTK
jgi:hypothetical protein